MEKQTMGTLMQSLRKSKGYSQSSVAEKLGVSNKTISSWECDKTTPDLYMLPAIADIYGVSIDELVRGKKEEKGIVNVSTNIYKTQMKNYYTKFKNRLLLIILFYFLTISFIAFGVLAYNKLNSNSAKYLVSIACYIIAGVIYLLGLILEGININNFKTKTDIEDDIKYEYWANAFKYNRLFYMIIFGILFLPIIFILVLSGVNIYIVTSILLLLMWISYMFMICKMHKNNDKLLNTFYSHKKHLYIFNIGIIIFLIVTIIKGNMFLKYHPEKDELRSASTYYTNILQEPKDTSKMKKDYSFDETGYLLLSTFSKNEDEYKVYIENTDTTNYYRYNIEKNAYVIKNSEYLGNTTAVVKQNSIYYLEDLTDKYTLVFVHLNMEYEYTYNSKNDYISLTNIKEKHQRNIIRYSYVISLSIISASYLILLNYNYFKKEKNN